MARATTSEATPAATPTTEMPVMMPMNACLLFARRYRDAMKISKRMRGRASDLRPRASAQSDYSWRGCEKRSMRGTNTPYATSSHQVRAMAITTACPMNFFQTGWLVGTPTLARDQVMAPAKATITTADTIATRCAGDGEGVRACFDGSAVRYQRANQNARISIPMIELAC